MRRLSFPPSSLLIGLLAFVFVPQASASPRGHFQCNAVLQGRILDQNGAAVPRARISAQNTATGLGRTSETDTEGSYQIAALPVGNYRVEARAQGFGTKIVEHLNIEVARIIVQDFRLVVGDITQTINVASDTPLLETATLSVGQVISERTVQEIPLNKRYFIDLGVLIPGSVTPPQKGQLSPPTQGGGSLALNTAGIREDTVTIKSTASR